MLGTLIESRAIPERRTGSSLASLVIHGALVTAAVIATAKDVVPIRGSDPFVHRVTFTPPAPLAPVQTLHRVTATLSTTAAPIIQRLNVPVVVPMGIPPVDLTVAPTRSDFRQGPIGSASVLCDVECQTTAPAGDDRAIWAGNDALMRLLEPPVAPRYPEALRRAGVEGEVIVRFIVDTTGRVDMRSIEIVRATHDAFTSAVRESLARLRFSPAMIGTRKVAALAMMPFRFTLK